MKFTQAELTTIKLAIDYRIKKATTGDTTNGEWQDLIDLKLKLELAGH